MCSENLNRLNKISSAVGERDLSIWENVVSSLCIRRQTDNLKIEIDRMKTELIQKKRENELLSALINQTYDAEQTSFMVIKNSIAPQYSYNELLTQEMNDFRKKYHKILEEYDNEYRDYRSIYEKGSPTYKELKLRQVEMKKLDVRYRMLKIRNLNLLKNKTLYMEIQKKMFTNSTVKFAEFYIKYHKLEKLKLHFQNKKKEEQLLIEEHFKLTEEVRELKKLNLGQKLATAPIEKTPVVTQTAKSVDISQLKRFLDEDFLPCSLTTLSHNQLPVLNKTETKVKILDMKILERPISKKPVVTGPKSDLRKQVEAIKKATKVEIKKTHSFQINRLPSSQDKEKISQSKNSQPTKENTKLTNHNSKTENLALQKPKKIQVKNDKKGSQNQRTSQNLPKTEKIKPKMIKKSVTKETPATSILKNPSQNKEQENVSNYFTQKKKSVTFDKEVKKKEVFNFATPQSMNSTAGVKNLDVFKDTFVFKKEDNIKAPLQKKTSKVKDANFTIDANSALATYGGDSGDRKNDMTFEMLDATFDRTFGGQTPQQLSADDSTAFSFFGSQPKTINPFSFI